MSRTDAPIRVDAMTQRDPSFVMTAKNGSRPAGDLVPSAAIRVRKDRRYFLSSDRGIV